MKNSFIILISTVSVALAGSNPLPDSKMTVAPPLVALSPYHDTEFNVSLFGTGSWTQTRSDLDRYLGVDHAFGGTAEANFFFKKYFGVGLGFTGYDVRNVSTPARVATSTDARRFVGDLLLNTTFRYPIGTTPFSPFIRGGIGAIFNGGNSTLKEPNCTVGCEIRFEKVEHDAKGLAEIGAGVEFRINHTFGIVTEGVFDKVFRPQSNFFTIRTGVNVAF